MWWEVKVRVKFRESKNGGVLLWRSTDYLIRIFRNWILCQLKLNNCTFKYKKENLQNNTPFCCRAHLKRCDNFEAEFISKSGFQVLRIDLRYYHLQRYLTKAKTFDCHPGSWENYHIRKRNYLTVASIQNRNVSSVFFFFSLFNVGLA